MKAFALRASPTVVFLGLFFVAPVALLVAYSFATSTFVTLKFGFSLDAYREVFSTGLFRDVYLRTLWVGVSSSALAVVLAYPLSYVITLGSLRRRGELILVLVLVSLFSAYIVRIYAWRAILGRRGAINELLQTVGLIDKPIDVLLYTKLSLLITYVNVLVPLAVLPLYASLSGIDRNLLEASRSLGASSRQTFTRVVLPLTSRGTLAAFAICFVVASGDYVTPQLVGGSGGLLVGNLVVARFGISYDWPLGSALAIVLITAFSLVILAAWALQRLAGLKDRPS